jgi:hypothetical protein
LKEQDSCWSLSHESGDQNDVLYCNCN